MISATASPGIVLASIPSPDRGVWELGPIPIRAYALCIIAGIVLAIWWGERRWAKRGGERGTIVDIAVFAVPFGLVGGRLYHVITDYYRYFGEGKNPLDALRIWDGGLGIWGAIALGGVGAWIACRRRGIPLPAVADSIAPGIVVAQAVGRLGNYFNQELYGGPTDLPWGLEIYQRIDEATGMPDPLAGVAVSDTPVEIVHPTFLYELLWNLAVAALVVWATKRFRLGHGRAFALYVAGYTLGRTWIEMMRTDDASHVFGVRVNVWVSILVFLGAVVYMIVARGRGPQEDIAALTARQAEAAAGTEDDAGTESGGRPEGAQDADTPEDPGTEGDTATPENATPEKSGAAGTTEPGADGPRRDNGE